MKKTVIAGIITGILVVVPAHRQAYGQASTGASVGVPTSAPTERLGTRGFVRGSPTATLDNLRKAAAGGCSEKVKVIALVDDSLSSGQLARYGWRIVTRIGEVATLAGCAEIMPYLCALPGIKYVKTPSRAYSTLDSVRKIVHVNEVHKTIPGWTGPRLTGKGVLFGLIDTDFDTRHKAFLDSNGLTRFVALWDQAATPADANPYGYGVIKNHAGILADSMFGLGSVGQGGHGTFTASYGAGSDWASPYYGVAPDVVIAAVKTTFTDADIIDGLDWLFSIADSLGLPCVVNISIGVVEGPHDGTSLVDRAIDNVSAAAGHIVVGASGNDGNNKEHVYLQMASGQSRGTWATPIPYSRSWYVTIMEIWGDSGKSIVATFNVLDTVTMNYGPTNPLKRVDSRTSVPDAGPQPVLRNGNTLYFWITAVESASPLNGKPHIQTVMFSPTPPAPALYWGAYVSVPGATGGSVHVWNVRQKSFRSFGVANYYDGDTLISVNEVGGTAKRNITVGAYYGKLSYALWGGRWSPYVDDSGYHALALFSGRGPTVDGRVKPDITAPGSNQAGAMARFLTDKSNMVYWPDSPAVEDRYAVTGGTSVASPIVAGVVALMLQYNPSLTVEQARTIIQTTAINDSATGPIGTMYNSLWGAGKVNALGAVDKMINGTAVGPPKVPLREASSTYGLIRLSGNRLKFIGSAKGLTVELFSLSGRRLMRQTSLLTAGSTLVVSLAPLPQGVYFARAVEKGRVLCSKKISVLY